jgi:hypothetical protein
MLGRSAPKDVYTAPDELSYLNPNKKKVFLAGTIDMGTGELWQPRISDRLQKKFIVFNPRRENFQECEQSIRSEYLLEQIQWETNALNKADTILMYFAPGSQSPIALLELGLYARSGKLLVVCPDEYCRQGNVQYVCALHNIPFYKDLDEAVNIMLYT